MSYGLSNSHCGSCVLLLPLSDACGDVLDVVVGFGVLAEVVGMELREELS